MLDNIQLENLICIDIETVPQQADFKNVPENLREMYLSKAARLREEGESDSEQYFNHAAIFAEFGKVICISVGIFVKEKKNEPLKFRIKSFAGDDEKSILKDFAQLLNKYYKADKYKFCGHNIKEFDVPYLCRRLLIHQLPLPKILDLSGKKPYEVNFADTMQLWRFGDYKHFTSLKLLAAILNIDSPKEDIEGKDVGSVYWHEKNLKRIVEYCQRDVLTVAQIILRFKNLPLLSKENISIV